MIIKLWKKYKHTGSLGHFTITSPYADKSASGTPSFIKKETAGETRRGAVNWTFPVFSVRQHKKKGGTTVGGGAVQITPSRLRYRYSEATPSLGKKGTSEGGQSSPPIALAMNGGVARSAGVGVIKANDPHLTASGPLLRGRRTRRGADARFFGLQGNCPTAWFPPRNSFGISRGPVVGPPLLSKARGMSGSRMHDFSVCGGTPPPPLRGPPPQWGGIRPAPG